MDDRLRQRGLKSVIVGANSVSAAQTHQTIAIHSAQAQPRLPEQHPDQKAGSERASSLLRKGRDNGVASSPHQIFDKNKVMKLLVPT